MDGIFNYVLCPKCHNIKTEHFIVINEQGELIETDICPLCNDVGYILIGKVDPDSDLHEKVDKLQKDMDKTLHRIKKVLQNLNAWEEDD